MDCDASLGHDNVSATTSKKAAMIAPSGPTATTAKNIDARVKPQRPDRVASALVPDYALGSHTASLGLASSPATTLPDRFRSGMFIGQHGSWNRVSATSAATAAPSTAALPSLSDPLKR